MDARDYEIWSTAFTKLMSRYRELTPEQRANVRKSFAYNSQGQTGGVPAGGAPEADIQDDWLISGVLGVLRKRGLAGKVKDILEHESGKKFLASAASVEAVILGLLGPISNQKQARLVMIKLVILGLYRRYERLGINPTPRMILASIGHAREVLEASFPGYADANMFPLIIHEWLDKTGDPPERIHRARG